MYIKIYFNDKPLFLCDAMTPEISAYAHHDDAVLIDEFSPHAVNAMIHEMRLAKIHAGIFLHSNLEELRKAFWKKFRGLTIGAYYTTEAGFKDIGYIGNVPRTVDPGPSAEVKAVVQAALTKLGL